jgi:hypothetical protein
MNKEDITVLAALMTVTVLGILGGIWWCNAVDDAFKKDRLENVPMVEPIIVIGYTNAPGGNQ